MVDQIIMITCSYFNRVWMRITIAVNIEVDEEKNSSNVFSTTSYLSINLVVKLICIDFLFFRKRHKNSCLSVHFA